MASILDYGKPQPSNRTRPVFLLSIVGMTAIFGYLIVYHYHHESKDNGKHLGDFPTFYQAAQFALQHRDIYTAGRPKQMYVYPPLIAFVYAPLTKLPVVQAAHVMLVLTAIMLLASILIASRTAIERADVRRPALVCVVAFLVTALGENELRAQLTMLETDALMLLMFTLALWWLDRRPVWAGLALAFAFNIKYLSIVTLPYLILRGRWKAAGSMVLGSIFFALLPALLLGWHEEIRCLQVATGGLLRWVGFAPAEMHSIEVHNLADDLSLSITSGIARLMSPRGFSNPKIMLVATGIGLVTVAIAAWMYRLNGLSIFRRSPTSKQAGRTFSDLAPLEWAGLVTAALVFSPNTNSRHLILAVLVNSVAAVMLLTPTRSVSRIPTLIGLLLILFGFIMISPTRGIQIAYFTYSIPCWSLLVGYLMILWTGLRLAGDIPPRVVKPQGD